MKYVFVDTNGWIALANKRDQYHKAAVELNKSLLDRGCRYITTNYILDETLTGILYRVGYAAAVDFGQKLRSSQVTTILFISESLEEKAWQLFCKFADKRFSFTDCTSFVIMEDRQSHDAFTNGHHFEQMGYTALMSS
ncbi:MAG: PIN domain-containing protein [candidate division KSB1 bacterium]|nr:PIN domain-containing protein [candidate division KSB1 bacterium]MDQ7063334.1 PIN domain-containing protein [candidate division KSB1 bacterium]